MLYKFYLLCSSFISFPPFSQQPNDNEIKHNQKARKLTRVVRRSTFQVAIDSDFLWNRSSAIPESAENRATTGLEGEVEDGGESSETETKANSCSLSFCPIGPSIVVLTKLRSKISTNTKKDVYLCKRVWAPSKLGFLRGAKSSKFWRAAKVREQIENSFQIL